MDKNWLTDVLSSWNRFIIRFWLKSKKLVLKNADKAVLRFWPVSLHYLGNKGSRGGGVKMLSGESSKIGLNFCIIKINN